MSAKYRIGRLETANPVTLNIPNALPMHFQIAGMMSPSMVGSLEAKCYFFKAGRKLIRGFFRQILFDYSVSIWGRGSSYIFIPFLYTAGKKFDFINFD